MSYEYRDPTVEFWVAVAVGRLDGSIDLGLEVVHDFDTEREAVAFLRCEYEQYGCEGYVYRVTPAVSVLHGGKPKVERMK